MRPPEFSVMGFSDPPIAGPKYIERGARMSEISTVDTSTLNLETEGKMYTYFTIW